MKDFWKLLLYVVFGGIAIYFGFKLIMALVTGLLGLLFSIAIPAAIVGGIGYVLYRSVKKDRMLSGNKNTLP